MTNRPKAIGTAAETAVVRYLAAHGFPAAERRALHGATDLGDITGTPQIVWERATTPPDGRQPTGHSTPHSGHRRPGQCSATTAHAAGRHQTTAHAHR